MYKIFVYGSLRKGHGNHHLMEHSQFLGDYFAPGELISLGFYPAALHHETKAIKGELYEVDASTLRRLDNLEGHPYFYRREPVVLNDGSNAEMYYLNPERKPINAPLVESGDWNDR